VGCWVQVWFKADLRTADHPGLLAAVQRAAADGVSVIPFFCLDPQLYADLALTPKGPEGEAGGSSSRRDCASAARIVVCICCSCTGSSTGRRSTTNSGAISSSYKQ
jgi:hypothetical protein